MCKVEIKTSTNSLKKLMAIFTNCKSGEVKKIHFGARGMSDFTKHHDEARKQRYFNRHKRHEDWENPYTAGSLSRYILWNKPDRDESIEDYKRRFNFS